MLTLALALALLAQDPPAGAQAPADPAAAAAPVAPEERWPTGAPREDYPFVAWCYGALRGYLELHDQVMPEVTRIESTWRRPGSKLSDDLKVYELQQRQGHADLKRFKAALTAAERASLQPINVVGAAAVQRGRAAWTIGPDITKARLAQEWMSWTLPARCPAVADALEKRARLLGASLKVNAAPEDAPTPPTEQATAEPAPSGKN